MALEPLGVKALVQGLPGFLGDLKRMDKGIQGVGQRAKKLGSDFVNLGNRVTRMGMVAATAAIGGIAALGVGLTKLAIDAAPIQGIKDAFEGLTQTFEGGSEAMLRALKRSSASMVANVDLMKSFNQAAQLVGIDFAQRLPDAMQYLGKVAAATGEDMGFMLDSLVRGVGRLSPMILDNLGIQVDLTAANEAYAEQLGITVDEMTKAEQQTALMNQVMAQLEINTANMPPVAGSMAQQFAVVKTTLKDLRDETGLSLLPAFRPFVDLLAEVVTVIAPEIVKAFKRHVIPTLTELSEIARIFLSNLMNGVPFLLAIESLLLRFIPQEVNDRFWGLVEVVRSFVAEHGPKLIEVIKGIGTALAASAIISRISAIFGLLTAIASPIGLLLGIISALAAAWIGNWGGIREKTAEVWQKIKPIIESIAAWIGEKLPIAVAALTTWFNEKLLPVLRQVWSFIETYLVPLVSALARVIGESLRIAFEVIETVWNNLLKPALTALWEFLKDKLAPVFEIVKDVIGWVTDKLNALADILSRIEIPEWLRRGSPSPFELTFIGAGEAIKKLTQVEFPRLQASMQMVAAPATIGREININMGGQTITSGMDLAEFENRVLSIVSRAVGMT